MSSILTEMQLTVFAVVLYWIISPIHGISKITKPIIKKLKLKSEISLLLFTGLLFGLIYYYLVKLVLNPVYTKLRAAGFKVGGQGNLVDQSQINYCENTATDVLHQSACHGDPANCSEECANKWLEARYMCLQNAGTDGNDIAATTLHNAFDNMAPGMTAACKETLGAAAPPP